MLPPWSCFFTVCYLCYVRPLLVAQMDTGERTDS
jgi:hypothetical protein